jgi:hypothetical protein
MKKIFLFLPTLIFFLSNISAQDIDSLDIDDLYVDFAVPDLGAFTLLGITPNAISKPGSVKEFTADALTFFKDYPKISTGLAIEYSPYFTRQRNWEKKNESVNYERYRKTKLIRGLSMTFGTAQDSTGLNMAAGLKWTICDNTDPLLDKIHIENLNNLQKQLLGGALVDQILFEKQFVNPFLQKVAKLYEIDINPLDFNCSGLLVFEAKITESINKNQVTSDVTKCLDSLTNNQFSTNSRLADLLKEVVQKLHKLSVKQSKFNNDKTPLILNDFNDYLKEYENRNWNRLAFSIGFGQLFNSPNFAFNNLEGNHMSYYANFATPFSKENSINHEGKLMV